MALLTGIGNGIWSVKILDTTLTKETDPVGDWKHIARFKLWYGKKAR